MIQLIEVGLLGTVLGAAAGAVAGFALALGVVARIAEREGWRRHE